MCNILLSVLAAHEVNVSEIDLNAGLDIFDEHKVSIKSFALIKQFKSCSHFFVEIDLQMSRKNHNIVAEVSVTFTGV